MIYWKRELLWKKPAFNNLIINVLKELNKKWKASNEHNTFKSSWQGFI